MPTDILPFIRDRSFDVTSTLVMAEAYEKARRMLSDQGQPKIVQEVIVKRIIELALQGVTDPDELARRALQALGVTSK